MQNIMHINDDDRNRTATGHDGAAIYLGNAVYRDSLLHGLIVCKYSIISNRGTLLALLALWAIVSVTATALVNADLHCSCHWRSWGVRPWKGRSWGG